MAQTGAGSAGGGAQSVMAAFSKSTAPEGEPAAKSWPGETRCGGDLRRCPGLLAGRPTLRQCCQRGGDQSLERCPRRPVAGLERDDLREPQKVLGEHTDIGFGWQLAFIDTSLYARANQRQGVGAGLLEVRPDFLVPWQMVHGTQDEQAPSRWIGGGRANGRFQHGAQAITDGRCTV